jgi:photosystem II stability/assembly factor-like uncharacterized protein
MSITSPPRPPRPSGSIDPDELEAFVEALIEEARLRARRRRQRNGAVTALALLLGLAIYFGIGRGGSAPSGAPAAAAPSAGAGASQGSVGAWAPTHGPGGGPAMVVAVAQSAHNVVYAGTIGGIFRSTNAGRTWMGAGLTGPPVSSAASPPGLPGATALVVDPRSPSTLYATRNDRWQNGGVTYTRPLFKSTNGGRSWRTLAVKGLPVAITPTTLYAAAEGNRLLRTMNGGRSWASADEGLPRSYLWSFAYDPSYPLKVYAAMGSDGLFASRDGGAHWRPLGIGVAHSAVTAVAVSPVNPRTIVAGADTGVVQSLDGGRTWRMLDPAMGGHDRDRGYMQVTALLFDPQDARTLYATTDCTGVFKSTDGGARFKPVNSGLAPKCPWVYAVAIDPLTPGTLYAAEPQRGMLKSVDGGGRWHLIDNGLNISSVTSVVVGKPVYAAARTLGLFRSDDGGAHWQSVPTGLSRVDSVAVDPSDPRHLLASGLGLVLSRDGGRTWTHTTLGSRDVGDVVVDGKTAYAAAGNGVYGSSDGGRTWRAIGPPALFPVALALAPRHPLTVYVGGAADGASRAGGLYRSTDGGASWIRLTDALNVDVTAIAVDRRTPTTLYIGTPGGEGGIFESTDGGATWHKQSAGPTWRTRSRDGRLLTPTLGITSLVVDPAQPSTLYTATGWDGVFRSTDGGRSWQRYDRGLANEAVTALALDPTGRRLYGGVEAGGVVSVPTR